MYVCVCDQGATELTLEGVAGVGSEMERIHIAEKNKAMAAKLKVQYCTDFCLHDQLCVCSVHMHTVQYRYMNVWMCK